MTTLVDLIDEYWDLAWSEGRRGVSSDTRDGAAQACLSAITGQIDARAQTIADLMQNRDAARANFLTMQGSAAALLRRAEKAEAQASMFRDHTETLVELLDIIKEHWVDYDHVYSIAVHEARAALQQAPE